MRLTFQGYEATSSPSIDDIRPSELQRLYATLDQVRPGRALILELVGEPGMGKTCLLSELTAEAGRRGMTVLRNRCTENRRSALVRSLADLVCTTSSLAQVKDTVRSPAKADRVSLWPFINSHEGRDLLFHAVRELLGTGLGEGLVLVIDDFHWADTASIEMIEQLIHRPVEGPLLVVIAQRPRQTSPRLRGALAHGVELGVVHRIELRPLTLTQTSLLLGLPQADGRLLDLHEEGCGIPLYLMALAGKLQCGQIPEQLATLLLDEIGQLGPCESLIVAAAAVLDGEWDLETLSAVAEVSIDRTRTALVQLNERDLLRPSGHEPTYAFRHPLVRELAYANAGSAWRVAAHRRAKEFLARRGAATASLAHHVERSLSGPNDDDLRVLRRAAEEALLSDPTSAVHWLKAALRIVPWSEQGRYRETMILLARALGLAGRLRESRDLLQDVLRMPPGESPSVRAATIAFCALIECLLGNYAEARGLLSAELTALDDDDLPPEATALIIEHGLIGALDGQVPSCDQVNLAKRLARQYRDEVAEAGAMALSGLCDTFNDDIEGASEALSASATLADRLPDTALAAHPEYLGMLAWGEGLIGRFGDARRHFERGTGIARKRGQVHALSVLLLGHAAVQLQMARPADARTLAAEARELAEHINADHVCGLALALESMGAAWTGDTREAMRLGELAEDVLHRRRFHWSAFATIARATAARFADDPRQCLMLLIEAGGSELRDIPAQLRPSGYEMLTAAVLALSPSDEHAPVPGHPTESWALEAEAVAETVGLPVPRAFALAARAHVMAYRGEHHAASSLYRRAARLFSMAGMAHVQALTLMAQAALQTGTEAENSRMLAGELARRSGAGALGRETARRMPTPAIIAAAELTQRLSVLTSREREIAEIAGRGKRTREIAEQLSLSPRTVDVHLSRIYRKLEIPSRTALARLMADLG